MNEQFQRLQELFDRARQLSPEERSKYLAEEIGDDVELDEALQRLLRHHESGSQPLDQRAIQLEGTEEESERDREVTDS